jgi:hypothetical protein
MDRVLKCVVTGLEHSGTTIVSKTLMSHPDYFGGFECGLLLNNLTDFDKTVPFYDWMSHSTGIGHWGVSKANMSRIMQAGSFHEAYALLLQYSGEVGPPEIQRLFRNAKYLIDKTPAYIYTLKAVMAKIDVPVIVVTKSPRDQYRSKRKRQDVVFENFSRDIKKSTLLVGESMERYPGRILEVDFSEFVDDHLVVSRRMMAHIDENDHFQPSIRAYGEKVIPVHEKLRFVGDYDLSKIENRNYEVELNQEEEDQLQRLSSEVMSLKTGRSHLSF